MDSSSSVRSTPSPLERLRQRQMRDAVKLAKLNPPKLEARERRESAPVTMSFNALGLGDELMEAVKELGLTDPTKVQALGIPAVIAGENIAMASHTGSGKTLAYMLPIVQALRRDEAVSDIFTRAKRPRPVVLCPTRKLAEQVQPAVHKSYICSDSEKVRIGLLTTIQKHLTVQGMQSSSQDAQNRKLRQLNFM